MNDIKLNHDAEKVTDMFNLTSEDGTRIRNIITFETIKSNVLVDELYEDEDAAPRNIKTKSGCIERCLNHFDKSEEKAMFFMLFLRLHEGINMAYSVHKNMDRHIERFLSEENINSDSLEGTLKKLIVQKIRDDISSKFSVFDKIIECMKQANYNYELFENIYSEKYGDLTDSLSNAISSAKNNFDTDED